MLHLWPKTTVSRIFMYQNLKSALFLLSAWLLSCSAVLGQCLGYHPLPTQAQLPVADVDVVMQDAAGFIWYGTAGGGLCCDDSYSVTACNSETAGRGVMKSDDVTCMAEDSLHRIWFGTRAGLYTLRRDIGQCQRIENEQIGDRKVNCIAVTPDGAVWVGLRQNILKFSADGTLVKTLSIGPNKRQEPREMTVDSRGTLWVTVLRGGLITIDLATDSLTHQPWDYPSAASYIAEDTVRHCYWVGTWGGGIVRYPAMQVEPATLQSVDRHKFGSEVYNLWLDHESRLMWVATMDDVYAYRMSDTIREGEPCLSTFSLANVIPSGKKLINKLIADRRGNIWVPGRSPHTFIITGSHASGRIRRDAVPAMTQQVGYRLMAEKIASEGSYYWIYQNRTRLSLYDATTGQLAFMANDARPTPLSTQRPLARCRTMAGVWTCNGKRLVHAWHDGMTIHWEEVADALLPHYISDLSDEGDGRLLIGTEREVFLYNYRDSSLQKLADAEAVVHQVGFGADGILSYSTDAQAAQTVTDAIGHIWTLNQLSLTEFSPRTGATRTLRPSDRNIAMDSFTDITRAGDSICLGGIGAFCIIGSCRELDSPRDLGPCLVTRYDTLHTVHLSTMNHAHAADVRFAYRFHPSDAWTELPAGQNVIGLTDIGHGETPLYVRATDEYGLWSREQIVLTISRPWPLRPWSLAIAIGALILYGLWACRFPLAKNRMMTMMADAPARQDPHFMERVEALVSRNLANVDYGVDELSRDLSMSRMNMYRRFQAESSVTPSEYIRQYRLRRASELLRTTTKSVTEIAYEVGFTSPQYLAKCFRDEFGITPRQARGES